MDSQKEYRCSRCPATMSSKRLPHGWKAQPELVCKACVKSGWCTRAITLPVARVVGRLDAKGEEDEPVEGFMRHCHPAGRAAADLANWAIR